MKIAHVAPVNHRVSAASTYGVALNVANVCNGLVDLGHDVTLFTAGDADVKANVVGASIDTHTRGLDIKDDDALPYNYLNLSACYARAHEFDIIHTHYNLIGTYFEPIVNTPSVHTVHNPLPASFLRVQDHVRKQNFVSLSLAQRRQYPDLNWVANIYHGIDTKVYTFSDAPQDYLLFLGRIVPEKGVHHAINAAKEAGVPLIIAGMSKPEDSYWQNEIQPHIDGSQVQYVGPAPLDRKLELLRGARAMLFPSVWEEPFGLTMIEAMACGTPVIGFQYGSVPEIIQDGETGFVVSTEKQMASAIKKIHKLRREDCRVRAERLFSVEKMCQGYERVYQRIIAKANRKK